MLKKLRFLLLFLLIGGCVEPYQFVIKDDAPTLVVEAYISNRSFNETLVNSTGRNFSVKLSLTGDVTNVRPIPVNRAVVNIESTSGTSWSYTEKGNGTYELLDSTFKAEQGQAYRLRIVGPDETIYESGWEELPKVAAPPMGEITFEETDVQSYNMEALEWVLRSFQVVQTNIRVTENNTGEPLYYRWTFAPTWIYIAPLSSIVQQGSKCWATDVNYLNTYELQTDLMGGYNKDLFFIRTIRNERIFEKLSVLITQHNLTRDFYDFWAEMQDQNEGSTLMDTPPYNLKSNLSSTKSDKRVIGYFGVVGEQSKRWYFSKNELSYFIMNTLREDCLTNYGGPPAPECYNCTAYSFGVATTKKPVWWQD